MFEANDDKQIINYLSKDAKKNNSTNSDPKLRSFARKLIFSVLS